jgi:hypothetical protein
MKFDFNVPKTAMFGGIFGVLSVWWLSILARTPLLHLDLTFSTAKEYLIQYNFREQVTGISPGLGNALIKIFGGDLSNIPMGTYLGFAIAGASLMILGRWIYQLAPMARTEYGRVALVLFYGTIGSTLILSGFGIPTFQAALTALVNSIGIGVPLTYAWKKIGQTVPL